jgi:pimeloyl-ACP methyl ester carboxylesterase
VTGGAPAPAAAGPRRRWLLLRGLLREVGHWGGFLRDWQTRFPGEEVRAVDLPGCGTLHRMVAPAQVSDLLAFVRDQGSRHAGADPGPLWLVGLSLGGMVASEWRRRHPQEVAGAVIISSSAGGLCPPWQRLRPGGAWRLLRAALARTPQGRERQVLLATSARSRQQDEADRVIDGWVDLARARPVTAGNAARLLLAANRFRIAGGEGGPERMGSDPGSLSPSAGRGSERGQSPPPAIVASPTPKPPPALVLAGEADRLVHPACSRALAEALGAELQLHPRAGHDLPLDDAPWVLAAVAGWRSRVLGQSTAVRDA